MRDERQRLVGEPVPHFDRALQSLEPELHPCRVFREHGGDGLAREHLVPRPMVRGSTRVTTPVSRAAKTSTACACGSTEGSSTALGLPPCASITCSNFSAARPAPRDRKSVV